MTKIIVKKDINGWEATTYIDLEDIDFILEINTCRSIGSIATLARTGQRAPGGMIQHRLDQDYYKVLARSNKWATEKNIRALHKDVLSNIDFIIQEAKEHYSKKSIYPRSPKRVTFRGW